MASRIFVHPIREPGSAVMSKVRAVRGIWTATATPFDADSALDLEGVRRNATILVSEGADAILAGGSIGEHVALDDAEWDVVIRATVEAVAGSVPVVVAVGHTDLRVVKRRIERATAHGADGVVALPPYYFPLSGDELVAFYEEVAACGVPFLTYSNPTTGGPTIRLADLARIAALPHFAGHKEATPNPLEFERKREVLGAGLPMIAAAETQIAYTLLAGANGILTLTTTFAPAFMARLWRAASSGDYREVTRLAADLMAFRALVDRLNGEGSPGYLPVAKAALEIRGLAGGPPRAPVRPLSQADRAALATLLAEKLRVGPAASSDMAA